VTNNPAAQVSDTEGASAWLRRIRWLLLGVLILALAGGSLWFGRPGFGNAKSFDGKLNVLVRPPDRSMEPIAIELAGALPVQSGGAMCVDAHLSQPGFMYLIWLDSEGQVLPLYPWNNETLEVKDADQPPPQRRATNLVFSPLLGRTWTFGELPGAESVLLLARRTPLPADIKLASLISSAKREPRAPQSQTSESSAKSVTFIRLTRSSTDVSVVEDGKERDDMVTYSQEPLLSILTHLKPHFDFIHAAQFTHAGSAASTTSDPPSSPADR
jgi:hypothetical protein